MVDRGSRGGRCLQIVVEVLEDPGVGIVDDEAVIVRGGEFETIEPGAGSLAVVGQRTEASGGSINDN